MMPRKSENKAMLVIDLAMVALLIVNLLLISFDWMFSLEEVNRFFASQTPVFFRFYNSNVHDHFLTIDLVFVAIFLTEFTISWIVASVRHTYHRWFFYPFIHWYDLLGCIPLNAFRVARLLRIITITYRLHQLRVFPLEKTYLYRKAKKYSEIILEEISDRVVENIIDQAQAEVKEAGPTLDKVVKEVLRPKQGLIVEWASEQLRQGVELSFEQQKGDIRDYLQHLISDAFSRNKNVSRLEQIPMAGKALTSTLEKAIVDIVYNIADTSMRDLASPRNRALVVGATEIVLGAIERKEEDSSLHPIILDIIFEILEMVKKQVSYTKRWKIKELREKGILPETT
ncbi:MAG: ion transporter [Myxococcota bacterium]|nr:ion transporter [Myxococcota bacterium]